MPFKEEKKREKYKINDDSREVIEVDGNDKWVVNPHDLWDPVQLECGHKAWRTCLKPYFDRRKDLNLNLICPKWEKAVSETFVLEILSQEDANQKEKFNAGDPHQQLCPRESWNNIVEVGETNTNVPSFAQCSWGFSFWILCNNQHHENKSWKYSSKYFRFYDNPKTLRCHNWKLIIQNWENLFNSDIEWARCSQTVKIPEITLLSPLVYLILYLALPIILPTILLPYLFYYMLEEGTWCRN